VAHSRRFPARGQSPRRQVSWEAGPDARDVVISTSSQSLWTTGVVALQGGLTVVRIRGFINLWQTAGTAAGDGFFGAVGIGITTDEAFLAGVASIPSPLSDLEWDGWVYHSFWDTRVLTGTFSDGVNAGLTYQRIEIDTKAMRKLKQGMTLFGSVGQIESGTAVVEYNADTRVLVKLP